MDRIDCVHAAFAARSATLPWHRREHRAARARVDGHAKAPCVLHRSVGPKRQRHVEFHVVELRAADAGGLALRLAAVIGHRETLIVRGVDHLRIHRVDPHPVIVATTGTESLERRARII